jgi:predicted nucleotidyltransferase
MVCFGPKHLSTFRQDLGCGLQWKPLMVHASSMNPAREMASAMAPVIVDAAHPRRVILFGSQARGNATDDSDFDLMVVEDNPKDRHNEMVRLRRLLHDFPVPIDVLVVSEEKFLYWNDTPGNVYFDAATEGITLYDSGANHRSQAMLVTGERYEHSHDGLRTWCVLARNTPRPSRGISGAACRQDPP